MAMQKQYLGITSSVEFVKCVLSLYVLQYLHSTRACTRACNVHLAKKSQCLEHGELC